MNNTNGATPFDGSNAPQGNDGAQGYPAQGYQQQGYPQNGYPQNGQQGHPQQQWQPQEPPKKKNFFVRHKILTGLLALCVVGGIAAAAGGGNNNDSSTSSSSGTSKNDAKGASRKEEKKEEKKDALPAVGQPVRDGKFEFTITKVERGKTVVGQQYMEQRAQGEYTLVHVTVKNIGDQQQGLSDSDQKALDANGTQYSADSMAGASIQGNEVLFNQINPGNQVKGTLVFDTPKGTELTQIEFHDSFLSGGIKASL